MQLHTIFAGVALASLLTACGGGSGSKEDPPKAEADVMRKLSNCYRQHGAPDFPDPVQQPNGGWAVPDNTKEPSKATLDACQSIAAKLPQSSENHDLPAAEMAKVRQFGQCMRDKGLTDWPDPKSDGAFPLPARLRDKQVYVTQFKDCQQFLSDGRIRVADQ
jgi:hypothetical protein